jgi:hypothetical protein
MYGYKAITVNGKKIDEHRHLMQVKVGKKLGFNRVVHHLDEDTRNNALTNLTIMSRAAHGRLHGTGRKLSEAAKQLVQKANQELRPNAKLTLQQVLEIRELFKIGITVKIIAEKFQVSCRTVYDLKAGTTWYWLKSI